MKEDFSLGNESPVSYIFSNVVNEPFWTKEKYSEGIMPNGKSYIIYTFTDISTFNFTQRKLVEVVEGYEMDKSKYHIPDGVETETEKGATHKYIRRDGLEAIYEVLIDAVSVESITNNYQGTKMLPLQEYPKIGPTYNYAPNDDALTSDASIAHYYFDMIPFYWWGGVRD